MEELYNQKGVDALSSTNRPIPGQSLTSNPDEPRSFEGAPQFTEFKEALDFTVAELLKEENLIPLLKAVDDGMPVTDIVMQMSYVGFREGKWNPDLMLMMIEPLMYTVMSLSEKAGIEYRIDSDDDDMENENEQQNILQEKTKNIANAAKQKVTKISGVPVGALPMDTVEDINNIEISEEDIQETPVEETTNESESLLRQDMPVERQSLLRQDMPIEQKSLLRQGQ